MNDHLRKNVLLENGSQYEVEIRGSSIHAVELIKSKIKELAKGRGHDSVPNSIQIDFYLWGYRRDNSKLIDQKTPYHRVRSIFY